jgi:outer membrane protein TolC
MKNNQALKVTEEQVHESQSRVAEAKTNFLPDVNLNFLYTRRSAFR